MSATIIPFLNGASFDPEQISVMGEALDKAAQELHEKGQPSLVREIIATRIIEVAKTGERDPTELCKRALRAFGIEER